MISLTPSPNARYQTFAPADHKNFLEVVAVQSLNANAKATYLLANVVMQRRKFHRLETSSH
jgi:hypothetical protein